MEPRTITVAESGDPALGPFMRLPGTWVGKGKGFNMIALPYDSDDLTQFRLLINQYDEHLVFTLVDKAVPNRGLDDAEARQVDQSIVALDYEQVVHQVAAADHPVSGEAGPAGKAIHHEAGLFLHLLNEVTDGQNIARLATIPHGDTALLRGFSREDANVYPPTGIAAFRFRGLPLGVDAHEDDMTHFYFAPYKHFQENPFLGFDPVQPNEQLSGALPFGEHQTTILFFETGDEPSAIQNIPFVNRRNRPVSMSSVFWIHAYEGGRLFLQYEQVVLMEFFGRRDGLPGRIQWPHVSVNTLEKVSDTPQSYRELADGQ
jgi:hypothetical protein